MNVDAGLAYHDYLFFLAGLDAEWTRSGVQAESPVDSSGIFSKPFERFNEAAYRFRLDVESEAHRALNDGLGEAPRTLPEIEHECRLDAHLYSAIPWLPFGHADAFVLMLLDDFEAAHAFTAQSNTTVEEMTLGLCPKVEGFAGKGTIEERYFKNPADLVDPGFVERFRTNADNPDRFSVFEHSVQVKSPLFFFARLKLNGSGLLAGGLLFQVAAMRAVARAVGEAIAFLRRHPPKDLAIQAQDLEPENLSFFLVDMLGAEHIGLGCVCRNFSIPASILARVCCVSIEDVITACPGAEDGPNALDRVYGGGGNLAPVFRDLARCMSRQTGTDFGADLTSLRSTHAFRWTNTTLAVAPSLLSAEGRRGAQVSGYIEANSTLHIAPGHQVAVEKMLRELKQSGKLDKGRRTPHDLRMMQIGHGDLSFRHRGLRFASENELIGIQAFCGNIGTLVHSFASATYAAGGRRDVVGLSTEVSVPISSNRLLFPGAELQGHLSVLDRVLPAVRDDVFPDSLVNGDGSQGRSAKILQMEQLRCIPKKYSLPLPLLQNIQFLFQNFATIVGNPFTFDRVIDLFGIFSAFYRTLIVYLPSERRAALRSLYEGIPDASISIAEDQAAQIGDLVAAMQRSLEQRIFRAFPEDVVRDMNVDYRGGLAQPLECADAVLKCGLEVLRDQVLKVPRDHPSIIGIVHHVGFQPGIAVTRLNIGIESSIRLGHVITDASHLFRPPAYVSLLHEAFHMIYDELRSPNDEVVGSEGRLDFLPTVPPEWLIDERLKEIFVNLLVNLYVCREEPHLLAWHNMIQFAVSPRATSDGPTVSIIRLVEQTSRFFCCWYLIDQANLCPAFRSGEDVDWDEKASQWLARSNYPEICGKFSKFLRDYGVASSLYSKSRDVTGVICYAEERFQRFLEKAGPCLPILFAHSMAIFGQHRKEMKVRLSDDVRTLVGLEGDLDQLLGPAADDGRPVSKTRIEAEIGGEVDPIIIVGRCLRAVLKARWSHFCNENGDQLRDGTGFHRGDLAGSMPSAEGKARNEYLIQPGSGELYCVSPAARRRRIRHRVQLMKSLWDISAVVKSRSLSEMIQASEETMRAQSRPVPS